MSEAIQAVFENLRLELRRGCLILAVLAQLREEHYGYTLRKTLADHGIDIEESTLYPLLRRLETQGLLLSEWREHEKRNKRFYRLSTATSTRCAAISPRITRTILSQSFLPTSAHRWKTSRSNSAVRSPKTSRSKWFAGTAIRFSLLPAISRSTRSSDRRSFPST